MTIDKVRQHIDTMKNEDLQTWMDLVTQPSISAQGVGVEECADLLYGIMSDAGIAVEKYETLGFPILYGHASCGRSDAPTVLFYGHYDVQPPEPLEQWDSPPFEPTIRDGRLYGRGTGDNKGQLLPHILAVRSYLAQGELPVNVKFVFEGEEESGSPSLRAFVPQHKDLLTADLVVTSDGPLHESGAPVVFFGARGLMGVELVVQTARHDNHSGNKGGVIPNAAWELVRLLSTMMDENDQITIDGFDDGVLPPTALQLEMIDSLPFDPQHSARVFGVESIDLDRREFYTRLMMRPTLTINGMESGYTGPGTKTIIPSRASVKMDMRLVPDQDPEAMLTKIKAHVAKHSPYAQVIHTKHSLPSRTDPDFPAARAVIKGVEKARGQKALVMPSLAGTLPDYIWTKLLGLPSVGVPYANADEANHAPNENMELQCFFNGIHSSACIIDELGRM